MTSRISTRMSTRTGMTRIHANQRLASLFRPEDILHQCAAVGDDEIVRQLLLHLALEYGIGNFRDAREEAAANMKKDSPHIAPGAVAFYARREKIQDPLVSLATFPKGVDFAGRRIFLAAAVLIPADMPGGSKQIVHSFSKAFGREGDPERIANLASPLAVWRHFDDSGQKLPDHLKAKHVMAPAAVCLDGDDSLSRAIDLFLEHKTPELPVLNREKELIGVVTTRRLLKVCLPDYLMWIEDMRPFQNFEPIAEIIRKESSTWLRDIMVHNYARVTENAPAVLALKEISRRETDDAYVLRGKNLVGVIHLHEFFKAILR